MGRRKPRPDASTTRVLEPCQTHCWVCGQRLWVTYHNCRTLTTLEGVVQLRLKIRRCQTPDCERYHKPYRPEAEGRLALPHVEFGLDIITLIGTLRYHHQRSVPEIHRALTERGVGIAERSVTNLLYRYEELVALHLADPTRLQERLEPQGRVVLALDGLPIVGVVSDGQHSIRNAVASVLPHVPHQLCQFHYLREAARRIYEADRHAKKELKKHLRDVRALERQVEAREDAEAEIIGGYCLAVRSALTDDGLAPLTAAGLRLKARLEAIQASLERVAEKRGYPLPSNGSTP